MNAQVRLVQKWLDKYGIDSVIDAEAPGAVSPVSVGWDLSKVWTCWDSFDEMGSFVSPGYSEKKEIEGDVFVAAWFLGTNDFGSATEDIVVIDRVACEACETEGCETCDDLGWIETDYLAETSFQPKIVSDESNTELLEAAQSGNPKAMYKLGLMFEEQDDFKSSGKWLAQASSAGVAEASFHIARFLFENEREELAESWFAKAIEQGSVDALKYIRSRNIEVDGDLKIEDPSDEQL